MPNEDHGHHSVTIIVNARTHAWTDNKISFEQVVALAYPGQPITDQDVVTVRYSRGQAGHGSGTLTAGRDVTVKEGMVFDVYRTSRS
jgi:hypothetical protein